VKRHEQPRSADFRNVHNALSSGVTANFRPVFGPGSSLRHEFLDHALEMLAPLGGVSARAMFGGHGLYRDGLFFAIVLDGVLYLKADDESRAAFERAGCEIFSYRREGKRATLNFYRAPEETLESPQLMLPWARRALQCALRAQRATARSNRPRPRRAAGKPRGT
jgi:DNA transformation protein